MTKQKMRALQRDVRRMLKQADTMQLALENDFDETLLWATATAMRWSISAFADALYQALHRSK